MPTVKRETLYVDRQEWKVQYRVAGDGLFRVTVPEFVARVLGYNELTENTLDEAVRATRTTIKKYQEARTTTRKVIVYSFRGNVYIWDKAHERVLYNKTEVSFCEGLTLNVCAGVFIERCITVGAAGGVEYDYDMVNKGLPDSISHGAERMVCQRYSKPVENAIDWTPERQALFERLNGALESIYLELQKIKEPAALKLLADSGQFLLGAPQPPPADPDEVAVEETVNWQEKANGLRELDCEAYGATLRQMSEDKVLQLLRGLGWSVVPQATKDMLVQELTARLFPDSYNEYLTHYDCRL